MKSKTGIYKIDVDLDMLFLDVRKRDCVIGLATPCRVDVVSVSHET